MKWHIVEQMLERVERRAVPDHEDCASVALARCVTELSGDALHDLLVAFAVGKWLREMAQASSLDFLHGPLREIPVVAFTQAGITGNRKGAARGFR